MRLVSTAARALRDAGAATMRALPPLGRDLVGVVGGSSIVYGVWQIYQPAAWIVGGAMMVIVAILLARPRPVGDS